jgi:hypothetical protein
MRTLLVVTAAFAALITIAPIGTAHAEYVHGWVNGQPFHGTVYGSGPSGFGAGFAQGLANAIGDDDGRPRKHIFSNCIAKMLGGECF